MYIMKMLDDCIKQSICSAFSHLQWSAAPAFFVTHHPSIAPCDKLHSLVCKPNFACWEASDHSVAEQRFLCLNQELPQKFFVSSPLTTYSHHFQSFQLALNRGWLGGERTLEPATHFEPETPIPTQRLGSCDLIYLHIYCLEIISLQFQNKFCCVLSQTM